MAVFSLLTAILYFGLGSARQQMQSGDKQIRLQQVTANFLALLRKDLRVALSVEAADDALMIRTGREAIAWMREDNQMNRIVDGQNPQSVSFDSGLMEGQELRIQMHPDGIGLIQVAVKVFENKQIVFQINEKIQIPQRGEGGL